MKYEHSCENVHIEWLWTDYYLLRETTWNDVSIIVLEWLWMSSEQSWMDYKILAYFEFTSRLGRCEREKSLY